MKINIKHIVTINILIIISLTVTANQSNVETSAEPINLKFENIHIEGGMKFNVYITQSDRNTAEIHLSRSQADFVSVKNENNFLKIKGRNMPGYQREIDILIEVKELKSIHLINYPDNKEIKVNHPIIVKFENKIKGDKLKIVGKGRSHVIGCIEYNHLEISHAGAMKYDLSGSTTSLYLNMEGIGSFNGKKLDVNNGSIDAEGLSRLKLNVIKNGEIYATGMHYVTFNRKSDIRMNREGLILKRPFRWFSVF